MSDGLTFWRLAILIGARSTMRGDRWEPYTRLLINIQCYNITMLLSNKNLFHTKKLINFPFATALGPISSIETPQGKFEWVMICVLYLTGLSLGVTFVIRLGRESGGVIDTSLKEDGESIL